MAGMFEIGQQIDYTNLTSRVQKAVESAANILLDSGDWTILYNGSKINGKQLISKLSAKTIANDIESLVEKSKTANPYVTENGAKIDLGIEYGNFWGGVEVSASVDHATAMIDKVISEEVYEGALAAEDADDAKDNAIKLLADEFANSFNVEAPRELESIADDVITDIQLDLEAIVNKSVAQESQEAVDSMLEDSRYDIAAFIAGLGDVAGLDADQVWERYNKAREPIVAWYDDFLADSTEAANAWYTIRELNESGIGDRDYENELIDEAWGIAKSYLMKKIEDELAKVQ